MGDNYNIKILLKAQLEESKKIIGAIDEIRRKANHLAEQATASTLQPRQTSGIFRQTSWRDTKFTGKVFAQKNKHRATRDARFKKLFPQGESREIAAGATPNPRQTPICK